MSKRHYRYVIEKLTKYYGAALSKPMSSYTERELIKLVRGNTDLFPAEDKYDDDGGVIKLQNKSIVVSTDSFDEDIHFTLDQRKRRLFYSLTGSENTSSELTFFLGKNLIHKFLSDIYAMGAYPIGYTLDLGIPAEVPLSFILSLYRGVKEELKQLPYLKGSPHLLNANIRRSLKGISVSSTVIGSPICSDFTSMSTFHLERYVKAYLYLVGELGVSEYLRLYDNRKLQLDFISSNHIFIKPPYETIHRLCESSFQSAPLYMCDLSDGLYSALERLVLNAPCKVYLDEIFTPSASYFTADTRYDSFLKENLLRMKRLWLHSGDNIAYLIVSKDEIDMLPAVKIGRVVPMDESARGKNNLKSNHLKKNIYASSWDNYTISDRIHIATDDIDE